MALQDSGTILVLAGIGLPPYSARGIKQSLELISAAKSMHRTVNGRLIDMAPPQMRFYRSTIDSGGDVNGVTPDGLTAGVPVTVDCIAELFYLTAGGAPDRTPVPGSERVEGDYTYYRPRLDMVVMDFTGNTDEWGAAVAWRLDLEEQGGS